MKVITCISYYGSGSSALTDLVSEYGNVCDLADFEFRFLYCLDGIGDLEYHIVENFNRSNAGHALKRFEKLVNFNNGWFFSKRYSTFFKNDEYLKISMQYIHELLNFKYKGYNFYDLYDKGTKFYYIYQFLNKISKKSGLNILNPLKNEYTYCAYKSKEEFIFITKKYVYNLLSALNHEEKEFLEIDQLLPSSNIESYLKYIPCDVFAFVIDRDPRDIFLLGKYYWRDGISPKNVKDFCSWFKYNRINNSLIKSKNVINLKFEDLVFNYEETVAKIEAITGLLSENHDKKFLKFNPKRSVNNTRLWERHNNSNDISDIKYIEDNLEDYLYPYTNINNTINYQFSVKPF